MLMRYLLLAQGAIMYKTSLGEALVYLLLLLFIVVVMYRAEKDKRE